MRSKERQEQKLTPGDEVRVISPARSLSIIPPSVRSLAVKRLEAMGLKVSFAKHCEESDIFDSPSLEARLMDIHEAFDDYRVNLILTAIGGCNSIHLIKELDYELIKRNPKILCGYSDITTLQNAIFAKTGLVTYSGPHFSTFGCLKGIDYVVRSFQECLFNQQETIDLSSSSYWSDDEWYLDQEKRNFISNNGYVVICAGKAMGTVIGGNIDSFTALQGTDYIPSIKEAVLFLEDNYPMTAGMLDRFLHSLTLQKGFEKVRGIVFGRFQIKSNISPCDLRKIVGQKKELQGIPVIAQADFGHTLPIVTFPIGGEVELNASSPNVKLTLIKK